MKKLSVSDKLLIAACGLSDTTSPFAAEDLVVAAWRKFPDTFGLSGYFDLKNQSLYPDSNRVFAEIMGAKPIRKRGYLIKVGEKKYDLTAAGKERARLLLNGDTSERLSLDRASVLEVENLLASRAYQKFSGERASELTFSDASAFWGISARSTAIELIGKREALAQLAARLQQLISAGQSVLGHGRTINAEQVNVVLNLDSALAEKFQQDLNVILSRVDQRQK
jgi:hypothetical protein